MANDKDFILKNAIEIGGSTKVTIGDAPASGSVTVGYDLSVAAYDTKLFSVAGQSTAPVSIFFNDTGTKLFVLQSNGSAFQYSLSTAWDISTSSYDIVSFDPTGQMSNPYALEFANSGSKMYIQDYYGPVYEYTLSTAYDLSTASYSFNSYDPTEISGQGYGVIISPDGTKFYTVGASEDAVFQYSLSTAYDISTASYDSKTLSVASQDLTAYDITFNNDGKILFVMGNANDTVFQYNLSVAYDISTASYSNISFSVASQEDNPNAVCFKPDGTKMYVVGYTNDTIYQYSTSSTVATATFDTSTGNYFTHTPSADSEYGFSNAGDVQTFQLEVTGGEKGYELSGAAYDSKLHSVNTQEPNPRGMTFKPDGTKMYVVGDNNQTIFQYSLDPAWDVSTASYDIVSKDISSTSGPYMWCLRFNPNGTKMYTIGQLQSSPYDYRIYQYTLSSAYDLSTATYDNLLILTGRGIALGFVFNDDGTKFYLSSSGNDELNQYSLTSPYDVTSATYDSVSIDISGQTGTPSAIAINSDGTKLFVAGGNENTIFQYTLSTAYDLNSAAYSSVSFLTTNPSTSTKKDMVFKPDGTKVYVIGLNTIYQYSTGSAITITWDSDIQWAGGTAPDSPAANEKDIYTITTDDGGTTYVGVQSGDNFS